jgi:hypothetical protein
MPRSTLLAALVLVSLPSGSCRDAATLTPVAETEAEVADLGSTATPSSAADSRTIVRVLGDRVRIGDAEVARLRPATAPGLVDAELRPTRVLPELQEALAKLGGPDRPLVVVLAPEAPLSHVRAILASADASAGGAIRIVVDPDPAAASVTESRAGLAVHPAPTAGETELAVDLPDARPASALERLAASAGSDPTLVLGSSFAPCVDPPAGMRCIPGGLAEDGRVAPTVYVDEREATFADHDACYAAYGCRGRRGAPPRAALAATPSTDTRPMPMDAARAASYCAWAGKRAPTEEELARLAATDADAATKGLRCATHQPFLTRFPPRILAAPRPPLPLPEPPTAEELAIFGRVPDDPVEDKKICGEKVRAAWHPSQADGGRSEPTCRDPFAYLTTNEPRGFVWHAYIADLGGAYVGIGSDQSYSYIAAARSRWAWVMDYDPRVVQNHLRLRAFILAAPTPDEFVALFAPEGKARALAILGEAYASDPRLRTLKWGYVATRDELHPYFAAQRKAGKRPGFGWLRDDESYRYIRTLYEQGRLSVKAADLLVDGSMQAMGAAARELGVPVRIYYTSNAPTAWGGQVTPAYRRNVLALPFDAESLVLQTTDGGGSLRQKTKWHHNVQWGRLLHERLRDPAYDDVWKLLEGRIPADDQALTVLGLPSD